MEIHPEALWRLLWYSFFGGVLLGALYDTLRLSRVLLGVCHYADISLKMRIPSPFGERLRSPRKRSSVFREALLAVEDLVFCLAVGAVMMLLLFYGNDGGFRGFVLLGLLAGFLLYYATLGALVVRASEYLVFWLKTAVLYAAFYITRPFVFLFRFLRKTARRVYESVSRRVAMRRLRRYDEKKRKELLALSERGFVNLEWNENGNDQTYRSKGDHKRGQDVVHRGESPTARGRARLHIKRKKRRNERDGIVGAGAS